MTIVGNKGQAPVPRLPQAALVPQTGQPAAPTGRPWCRPAGWRHTLQLLILVQMSAWDPPHPLPPRPLLVQPALPPPMRPLWLLCPLPMLVPARVPVAARHPLVRHLDFTLSFCTQDFISISLRV